MNIQTIRWAFEEQGYNQKSVIERQDFTRIMRELVVHYPLCRKAITMRIFSNSSGIKHHMGRIGCKFKTSARPFSEDTLCSIIG